MSRTKCLTLYFAFALALLLGGVGALLADDPIPPNFDPINANSDSTKNCRQYATQCVTLTEGNCYDVSQDGGYCYGVPFTDAQKNPIPAAGFKVEKIRILGYCATPDPNELVSGCKYQGLPVQCAWYSCHDQTLMYGGVLTCQDKNNLPVWKLVSWQGTGGQYCAPGSGVE